MDVNALERRYRKLLRSYPPSYRRERGEEILTTLMDAAEERGGAAKRENVGLVLHGIRLRLAARSVPLRLVAVIGAVFVAVMGAAAGAAAGWQTAPDLPDKEAAATIATTALPGFGPVASYDFLFGWEEYVGDPQPIMSFEAVDYTNGYREFLVESESDDPGLLNQARENLAAAGWDVGPVSREFYGSGFRAARGDVAVHVTGTSAISQTAIVVERATPVAVPVLTIAGLLLGALAGWAVTVWLGRRMRRLPSARHAIVTVPLGVGFGLLALPTLFNLYMLGVSLVDTSGAMPIWTGYIWYVLAELTVMGIGAFTIGLLLLGGFSLWKPKPAPRTVTN